MKGLLAAGICCFLLAGCGYFQSGTWEDHPKNWKRAFGESKPADGITVLHSWYIRMPHFTAEFAWFFELKVTDATLTKIKKNPELRQLTASSESDIRRRLYKPAPAWFLPKPLTEYEVYRMGAAGNFLIFIDRSGGPSYWSAYQL
jgi:hypothetical protein